MTLSTISKEEAVVTAEGIKVGYILPDLAISTLKEAVIAIMRGTFFKRQRHTALKGCSIEVRKGECVALLGHNGCGKSTFLKVIAGIIQPEQGQVNIRGSIAPLIELGAGFDPELTGRENVFLSCSLMGLTKAEITERYDTIKDFSELGDFLNNPVKTYSSGMYMRLAFSCAVAIEAEVMLIDEILAVGDQNFQKKCLSKIYEIRNSGSTVILVSHDTNTVRQLADRVYVLDEGDVIYSGTPDNAIKAYDRNMHKRALAQYSKNGAAEADRKRALEDNALIARHGEKVSIDKVRLKNSENQQSSQTGASFNLSIDLTVKSTIPGGIVVGFAIMRNATRITGGNTKQHRIDVIGKGQKRITFNFKNMPLSTHSYSVIAAVHDMNIVECFDIQIDALQFENVDKRDTDNFDHDIVSPFEMIESISVESLSGADK